MAFLCIILLFSVLGVSTAFPCPGSYNCSCTNQFDGYELMCPGIMGTVSTIKYQPHEYVIIECPYTSSYPPYSHLLEFRFRAVKLVVFRFCQLPNGTFNDILEIIGIPVNEISSFTFTSYNNLTNTLRQNYFTGLSNLTSISLKNNGFTMIPLHLFKDMPKLKTLNLANNRVILKPEMFFYNPLLIALELGNNNLHSLPEKIFDKLENLKLLNLEKNSLTNLNRSYFVNLKNLEGLDLHANDFVTLPEDVLYDLSNLRNISLFHSNFGYLPGGLFKKNSKLQRIRLFGNSNKNLTELPSSLFQKLSNLLELYLHKNNLQRISNDFFWGLYSITSITLAMNQLEDLPKELFWDTKELLILDLEKNKITHLPDEIFQNLTKLQVLKLQYNKLKVISSALFSSQVHLKTLKLNHNELDTIKMGAFDHMKKLQEVDIAYNRLNLSNFNSQSSPFMNKDLKTLNLSHNCLTEIKNDWVIALLYLEKLDISYNNISKITQTDIAFISTNIEVDLRHNNIKTIDMHLAVLLRVSSEPFKSYRVTVYVDENPLVCDCNILEFVQYLNDDLGPNIKYRFQLDVGNLTCAAPVNLFGQRIQHIKYSDLLCELTHDCPLDCTCVNRRIDKATIVNCQGKNLTTFPMSFPDLLTNNHTILHLENNSITTLNDFYYTRKHSNITELYLTNNRISTINVTALPFSMQKIYLDNNNISKISADALTFLKKSIHTAGLQIALKGNPWLCNCDSVPFHQFLLAKYNYIIDYNNITCKNSQINFASLKPEELCPVVTIPIIIMCTLSVLFVIIVASLAVTYYRKQQTIKVWLYAHGLCLWFITETERDKDKVYDAFISYSHKDEDFVVNELVPGLEHGKPNYRLCIHIRDWMAGEWIPDQIVQSVEDSRRTIVVLSKNFIESVWGRLEFKAAHNQALHDKTNRVIIIVYGDIPSIEEVDDDLKLYMTMNTYLKWSDPWFWKKLRYAMPHQKGSFLEISRKKHIQDRIELITADAEAEINIMRR